LESRLRLRLRLEDELDSLFYIHASPSLTWPCEASS
jgi:hypothetical protein